MAFATFALGGLFFGLRRQQWRREAVSGAEDAGWPAGTAVVLVWLGIGLLLLLLLLVRWWRWPGGESRGAQARRTLAAPTTRGK